MASWIEAIFRSASQVAYEGALFPKRTTLNFLGASVSIADEPGMDRLNITIAIPSAALLSTATSSPTPNTLVLRSSNGASSFAGTCQFAAISASGSIACASLAAGSITCSGDAEFTDCTVLGELKAKSITGISGSADPFVVASAPDASGDSRAMTLATGDAAADNSGELIIETGQAVAGKSGNVYIRAGDASSYGSIALGLSGVDFRDGQRIVFVADAMAAPAGNPTDGGFLYSDAGALKWRGSNGTITTVAPA